MPDINRYLNRQLTKFWEKCEIFTFDASDKKFHWCLMKDCGLGNEIMLRLAKDIVDIWTSQGITDMVEFYNSPYSMTEQEVIDMVGRQVGDILRPLLVGVA